MRSPISVVLRADGNSEWIRLNWEQNNFQVSLAGLVFESANLSWTVQHTYDDFNVKRPVSIARVTTTATVTDTGPDGLGHRLTTGDCVIIQQTGSSNLDTPEAGAEITVVDATSYTYTVLDTGVTAATGLATPLRIFPHAVLAAETARADGVYTSPVTGCRLNVASFVAGGVELQVVQGMGR
jgi:hypothetical protein